MAVHCKRYSGAVGVSAVTVVAGKGMPADVFSDLVVDLDLVL